MERYFGRWSWVLFEFADFAANYDINNPVRRKSGSFRFPIQSERILIPGGKMRIALFVLAPIALTVSACETIPDVSMTPLQIQAMQQRDYEVKKQVLFASTVSVFQDLGYQVTSADLSTGFINASGNSRNSTSFFEAYYGGRSSKQTQATAFVEEMSQGRSRIRLNFVEATATSSAFGSAQNISDSLLDPAIYQAAFERIEEALFVRGALRSEPTPDINAQEQVTDSAEDDGGAAAAD